MLTARALDVDPGQDAVEFCYALKGTDGLLLVPPTEDRVRCALAGTGVKVYDRR